MKLYHGAHTAFELHEGQCFTETMSSAISYAKQGMDCMVAEIEADLTGLTIVEVDGYDRDENAAPGDEGNEYDADVLIFDDEDIDGRYHATYRLMTAAAIGRVNVISTDYWDEVTV